MSNNIERLCDKAKNVHIFYGVKANNHADKIEKIVYLRNGKYPHRDVIECYDKSSDNNAPIQKQLFEQWRRRHPNWTDLTNKYLKENSAFLLCKDHETCYVLVRLTLDLYSRLFVQENYMLLNEVVSTTQTQDYQEGYKDFAETRNILSGEFVQTPTRLNARVAIAGTLLSLLLAGGGYMYKRGKDSQTNKSTAEKEEGEEKEKEEEEEIATRLPTIDFDPKAGNLPFVPSRATVNFALTKNMSNSRKAEAQLASSIRTIFHNFNRVPPIELLNQMYANKERLFGLTIFSSQLKEVVNSQNLYDNMSKLTVLLLFIVSRVGVKKLKGDKDVVVLLRSALKFWTHSMKEQLPDMSRPDLEKALSKMIMQLQGKKKII